MRKFLVFYRMHQVYGEYEYYRSTVDLNTDEKANTETFEKKLNAWGVGGKEVLSWSLIEK